MRNSYKSLLALGVVSVGLSLAADAGRAQEDGFVPLFDRKTMTGLKPVGVKDGTFKVENGEIVCTGKPNGYFATEKSFKNYHLKFEWKFLRPEGLTEDSKFNGNSGCLVHIAGDHKVWPRSIEIQGYNKDMGAILFVSGAKKKSVMKYPDAQKKGIKPVGEWNLVEVISKDGKLTAIVNGEKTAECESDLTEGTIGWQSEGAPINFRNLRIKVTE